MPPPTLPSTHITEPDADCREISGDVDEASAREEPAGNREVGAVEEESVGHLPEESDGGVQGHTEEVEDDEDEDDDDDESDDDFFDDQKLFEDENDEEEDLERPKTMEEREKNRNKRPGNPGRFRGKGEELLLTFEPGYESIMQMKTGRIKELAVFWSNVREAYWGKCTWEEARAGMGVRGKGMQKKSVVKATNKVS